jgi:hypothetical protein
MVIDVSAGPSSGVPGGKILAKTDLQIPQGPESASLLIPLAVGIFLRLRRPQRAQR